MTKTDQIRNDVAIEFLPGCYAKALSNGNLVLGDPHPPGEGPEEEEIFTAISVTGNQFALKSGFGRYLGLDGSGKLVGLSEAIGEQESLTATFEESRSAICASNGCFLHPEEGSDAQAIVARANHVSPREMLTIRVNYDPIRLGNHDLKDKAEERPGVLYETEVGHLKKLQKGGLDGPSLERDKKRLERARNEGRLHEALLDHRVKRKSDKYCK